LAEVRTRQVEVETKLSWLEVKRKELEELQAEKEKEEAQHEGLKEQREKKLSQIRTKKSSHEQSARELEDAARKLEEVLAELERKRQRATGSTSVVLAELDRKNFGANRGKLPWPTAGEIITRFGRHEHPKYKTVTMSKGIDIAAPMGQAVKCVGDGVVDLVQWLPGYGQTVIVNHGNGFYSVYAHLSAVSAAAGKRVAPGEVVGAVGDTGSLKGVCLHFELRSQGSPQDPIGWLH
jgi:septal ring factor EnvC (AmiA/AmiB activator)